MTRLFNRYQHETPEPQEDYMSALSQQQASDSHLLEEAKVLLAWLWLNNRVTLEVRSAAEAALSAALYAIEFPGLRRVGMEQGKSLAAQQWLKKQREADREF
jgi:hypothetical protein